MKPAPSIAVRARKACASQLLVFAIAIAVAPLVHLACRAATATQPAPGYEHRTDHDPDGIGKFYLGREIAHVMGHAGMAWLERPEREQEEQPELLIPLLRLKPGDVVADVGAGSGYHTRRLARVVGEQGRVYAVDVQPEMIDELKRRTASEGLTNVQPVLGTITDPGLPANAIDLALLVDVYHEFSHPYEMMEALCRSLKPGGRVALVEFRHNDPKVPIKPLHTMSEAQVRREMGVHPLEWIETLDTLPWQKVFIYQRKPDANSPAGSPATPGPRTPRESAGSFRVFEDLVFEQVLTEPIVTQPVFLTFDEHARMWVVQYRQYPEPAGLKLVSRDNYWRAVYDRVPPPPPHHFPGADKITIHEDTDGDGRFDRHKTFLDGLNIVTSVAPGRGGVFVLNPPYLLFYPDRDRDDVPDEDPRVLLSGFGLEDTHSVANSIRWGPDGWLYGCQGSTVTGRILVHGPDGKVIEEEGRPMHPITSQGQNIWRYHPEKRVYEIFSEGGGNAFGLEIDNVGRIFSGHNGGNTRGFHYQQGAYLQKGFDKHGPLSNPHAFGYFPQMPHNNVDRFTHNFVIYDGDALGGHYQGRLFGVEPLQGRIVMSEITPEGSTFRTRDLGHPVTSDDPWFCPVDIKLGPDGAIYVCDWYDGQVNHYRNHEGQIDKSNGRIYRLRARAGSDGKLTGNGAYPLDRLIVESQESPRWYAQTALRLMADRRDKSRLDTLRIALQEANQPAPGTPASEPPGPDARQRRKALGLLWALHACGGFTPDDAAFCLGHRVPEVRTWTIRLLGDENHVSPDLAQRLADLAATEPDLETRAQLACTARRLPAAQSLPIVRNLLRRDPDSSDPRLPLLLWWAFEDKCAGDREAVLAVFSDRELWNARIVQDHVLERLMRRFAATGKREDLLTCARLFALSPGPEPTARLTRGFEQAYQGRAMVGLPEELLTSMARAGGESILIGARRGKADAVDQALASIADHSANTSKRLQYIQVFGETRQPRAVSVLLAVAREPRQIELRQAALGALQFHDSTEIASELLIQLPGYPIELRPAAFDLLTSRPAWTFALLDAVDAGRLDKTLVPKDSVHRIKAVVESVPGGPATLVAKHWPNVRQATSAELEMEIARLLELINLATGSPYTGKKLFAENCGVCHKLFGKGADVGPDLSIYQRHDLPNLLLNIVNPNAEIREGYQGFNVETRDGRSLTGFLSDQDSQVVVLRTAAGQSIPLPRSEIESMEPSGLSLMPEGLLSHLSDQQTRDLFAYLRSTQPLNDGN